jgi:dihydrofolate reductase
MRRIMAFDRVSADGYFAGPDGKLDWVVPDDELDAQVSRRIGEQDAQAGAGGPGTILFGRRTYEMFAAFWPRALDQPAGSPDPHAAGRRSADLRAMAVFLNEAEKVVFSRTLKDVTWKNSRLVRELDPRDIAAMKSKPGPDILVFGSGSIASELTRHGLIDEYEFIVCPVLLGGGRTLISGVPERSKVELLESTKYPSGNVMLRYARAK